MLKEKYTTLAKKLKDPKEDFKFELSSDAYAICEFIEHLINKIEKVRISLIK